MATCNKCGREIIWDTTAKGKLVPKNPSGAVHFSTCGLSGFQIRERVAKSKKAKRLKAQQEKDKVKQLALPL